MPNASQVLLLENPSSSVGAVDLTTHAVGVVDGSLSGPPELTDVLTGDKVHVNDLIVTSGQLNLYPRNLLIGQVTRISKQTDQLFQRIDIRPAADIQHLESVEVIRNWVPSVPAQLVPSQ
jgi:cell shape-determining protein MreC